MAKKRIKINDKQGNVVDYDISAASVTIDVEGKSLDVKLSELVDAIARSVKSVTFNGNSPTMDSNGNVNLGQQVQPDWKEGNINWPSYIKNKPSFSRVATTGSYNDLTDKPTIPEGVATDSQMSDSSDAPVKNRVIKAYVDNLISGLVNGAPQALDTLNELSAALGNDANFAATITQQLANKANSADVYTKSQTYNKDEVDAKVADAGKVKSVSVNDGEPIEPDDDGIVDLGDLQGPVGPTGPQGLQGNSGVASGDEVIVVNNLTEGGTDVEVDGVTKVKVLSAEMGKKLATEGLVESGTFSQAYAKAGLNPTAFFPWFLVDEDSAGNTIKKMIWHSGSQNFIDAIGSVVEGETGELIFSRKFTWNDFDYADIVSIDGSVSPKKLVLANDLPSLDVGIILKNTSTIGIINNTTSITLVRVTGETNTFTTTALLQLSPNPQTRIENSRLVVPKTQIIGIDPLDTSITYKLVIHGYCIESSGGYPRQAYRPASAKTLYLRTGSRSDAGTNYYKADKTIIFNLVKENGNAKVTVLSEEGTTYRGYYPDTISYNEEANNALSDTYNASYADRGIHIQSIIGPCTIKLYRM